MRVAAVALAVCITAAACGSGAGPTANPTTTAAGSLEPNGTVVRVVDGDTVDIDVLGTRERVRLIGIDTPETKKEDTPVECFGPEATAFTESLLPPGTRVRLERDVEPRDVFGRLLAYVYRADDGVFVNLAIIANGYARLLTIPPNVAHTDDFVAANRAAREAGSGLWSACPG